MKFGKLAIIQCVWWLAAASLWAQPQNIRVELVLDKQEIYQGESVILQVKIAGINHPQAPDLGRLSKDFQVKPAGDQSLNSSSIQIINGRMTRYEFYGHLFQYVLTPRRSGLLWIGPVSLRHQGTTFYSHRVRLKVIAPERGDYAFMRIRIEPAPVLVTTAFTVTLEIYLQRLSGTHQELDPIFPAAPLALQIPWLEKLPGVQGPSLQKGLGPYIARGREPGFTINQLKLSQDNLFAMFDEPRLARFKLPRQAVRCAGPSGQVHDYYVYTLPWHCVAQEIGTVCFGPVVLKGPLATKVTWNGEATSRKIVVTSPTRQLSIIAPPLQGRPASYTGGIGHFTITATVKPTRVHVGDPLTLTLTVSGQGSLKRIAPPNLSQQARLTAAFKVYEAAGGQVEHHRKVFRYTIRPKKSGRQTVPPLAFSYFDSHKRSYVTLHTPPLPITVEQAAKVGSNEIVGARPALKPEEKQLREISRGIFANHEKLDGILNQTRGLRPWHLAFHAAWPLLYLLLWAWLRHYRRLHSDVALVRRRQAAARARQRIAQARADNLPTELAGALTGYIADRLNLPEQGLVPGEIATQLEQHHCPAVLVNQVKDFLAQCESARYGAGPLAGEGDWPAQVRTMIMELEKQWV